VRLEAAANACARSSLRVKALSGSAGYRRRGWPLAQAADERAAIFPGIAMFAQRGRPGPAIEDRQRVRRRSRPPRRRLRLPQRRGQEVARVDVVVDHSTLRPFRLVSRRLRGNRAAAPGAPPPPALAAAAPRRTCAAAVARSLAARTVPRWRSVMWRTMLRPDRGRQRCARPRPGGALEDLRQQRGRDALAVRSRSCARHRPGSSAAPPGPAAA